MASTPGFEPGPHWWEPSALTTVPPLLLISSRLVNWEERYSGTRDVRHLKAMIAFLKYNWVATGSYLSSFKTGVMWSYVRILVAIRAAKFWIRLNLLWTKLDLHQIWSCANLCKLRDKSVQKWLNVTFAQIYSSFCTNLHKICAEQIWSKFIFSSITFLRTFLKWQWHNRTQGGTHPRDICKAHLPWRCRSHCTV